MSKAAPPLDEMEENIREEIAKISSLIVTGRRLLAKGTMIDLAALEDRVRILVGFVETLPVEDGRQFIEELSSLVTKLDRLGEELQEKLVHINLAMND